MKKNYLVGLLACSLFTSTALSQSPSGSRYVRGQSGIAPAPQAPTFDLEFKGGPVEILVLELKERIEPPPNLMIAPGLYDVEVPPFDFRNVTLSELLQALNTIAVEGKSGIWLPANSDKIWVFNPKQESFPYGAGMPAPQPAAPKPQPPQTIRVFAVGRFMEHFTIEDITTAVQTALDMSGNTNATMKFHKDTNLLLVAGHTAQLDAISQVLNSIEESVVAKKDETATKQKEAPKKQTLP